MKALILATTLILSASTAHASTVGCTTNTSGNPIQGATTIEISQRGSELVATEQRFGGIAMYESAPESFPVQAQSYGPEVVEYKDAQGNWLLEVSFQPINGHIYGTLTTESEGQRYQFPVVCSAQ